MSDRDRNAKYVDKEIGYCKLFFIGKKIQNSKILVFQVKRKITYLKVQTIVILNYLNNPLQIKIKEAFFYL